MHCASCAANVESALKKAEGIESASVDISSENADIMFDPKKTSISDIEKIVEDAGYGVLKGTKRVKIGGMHCASCAGAVKDSLLKTEGVLGAEINLIDNSADITYVPGKAGLYEFKKAIESAGYEYLGTDEEVTADVEAELFEKEQKDRVNRIIIGFGVSILLIAIMFSGISLPFPVSYLMFVITTPAFIYLGYPIFKAAFAGLRNFTLNMDVMYALGIGVAYVASVLGTFEIFLTRDFMFYETSVMLTAFLTLGRYLEANAKGKTNDAVKKLIELRPKTAFVKKDDGFAEVSAEELVPGDEIMVKPGGRIPVDGVVISGEAYIDESVITGESLPVKKAAGDAVVGGTLNTSGSVVFRSTKVGRDTVLFQIIRLVEETQRQKPPVQRLADVAVTYFIPTILTIAMVASLVWYFLLHSTTLYAVTVFVSVIVVACPCALGLATPTAVTVGIGRGAELGILIKNGEALETAEKLKCVVFDKTGTLTVGKPVVTSVKTYGMGEKELLEIAAGAEMSSEHPIAKAVVNRAGEDGLKPVKTEDFMSFAGGGVSANYDGKEVLIGNSDFITGNGGTIPDEVERELGENQKSGKTAVIVAVNRNVAGIISVSDMLKKSAVSAIEGIKNEGLSVAMVTGDNAITAFSIADEAGIKDVYANVLPKDKSEEVGRIREKSGEVAFVGDGINDAPALAKADVGIAVGSGTDVALESADIILMRDNLLDVLASIQLSKKVMGRIKLNLFWAFAYNAALIPLAAGILYPFFGFVFRPEYAGAAMVLSSVTVVTLSLLLKNYTPPALMNENPAKK
ncbi:Cu+-exporting ATPase [Methanomicrobium sp. W14]|nr:heavy metal translocating P-type ATPase [Methanomicrobium sp. W14]MBP2133538.1 Cu+-exporting ATPase [Methanomicrobium sp. W14]